jgi:putative hydrolase of HD superfamily
MVSMESVESVERMARFIFEMCSMKNVPRSGWFKVGIDNPESVAEHSFLTAIIAYFIAREEGCDPFKAAFAALLHDSHESRTLDLHRLAKRYVEVDEERARREQTKGLELPDFSDVEKVVRDADKLELLVQAKIYSRKCKDAMKYVENLDFETETGKRLEKVIREIDDRWWLEFEVHL